MSALGSLVGLKQIQIHSQVAYVATGVTVVSFVVLLLVNTFSQQTKGTKLPPGPKGEFGNPSPNISKSA